MQMLTMRKDLTTWETKVMGAQELMGLWVWVWKTVGVSS